MTGVYAKPMGLASDTSPFIPRLWKNLCEITGVGFRASAVGGREDEPDDEQGEPDDEEVVARLAARQELEVVAGDHHDAEHETREHRVGHPQLAARLLLRGRRRVARALA